MYGVKFHSVSQARARAQKRLPKLIFDFIDGAAGEEAAARANQRAFTRIHLQPRVLRGDKPRALNTEILGQKTALPFGFAPMGMCNLAWQGADQMLAATARAAQIPVCVSTAASTSLEQFRHRAGQWAWFQLYPSTLEATLGMAKRAEKVGYTHLVLTVDVPQVARRVRDLSNGFQVPFRLTPRKILDFARHPSWSIRTVLGGVPQMKNFASQAEFVRDASRCADWDLLKRLRAQWRGKLIVKGILAPEDAQRAQAAGADAVYVSNHGGRQLASAPPAITQLPRIRAVVGEKYPLLFDSGVTCGEDILKALALGANFVLLGRATLFGIAADGRRGLGNLVKILRHELSTSMAQLGAHSVAELNPSVVVSAEGLPYHTKGS